MLNAETYAYAKQLVREGHTNMGTSWPGGATEDRHYLDVEREWPIIAPIAGQDTLFKAALLKAIEGGFGDEDMTEAAETLLERMEAAAHPGSQDDIVAASGSEPDPDPPKPPGDSPAEGGTSRTAPTPQERAERRLEQERAVIANGEGELERTVRFSTEEMDSDNLTVPIAFSSEAPYERHFGNEILGHKRGEVRTQRLKRGLPVLVEHGGDQVGILEQWSLDEDGYGRGVMRLSKHNPYAVQVFNEFADGIRRFISVGYLVHQMKEVAAAKDSEPATFRVTDWEPLEVSVVAAPADIQVGAMRSAASSGTETESEKTENQPHCEETTMSEETKTIETPAVEPKVDTEAIEAQGAEVERKRISRLYAYADDHKTVPMDVMQKAVTEGWDVSKLSRAHADFLRENQDNTKASPVPQEDADRFSLLRLSNYLAKPTRENEKAAGYELEMCEAEASSRGASNSGTFSLPGNIWKKDFEKLQRDLTIGTSTAGGYLKPTEHGPLVDMLRNKSYCLQLGTVLTGLVGDVTFPTQSGGATAYWVAESTAVNESQQTFGKISMAPKTVGTFTDMSRKTLLQTSPSIEAVVRNDLLSTIATEIDRVCIEGSTGSGEPEGILNTGGIGSVSLSAALSWATIPKIWAEVSKDNADVGRMAWMTSPAVIGHAMQKERGASAAGNFILNDLDDGWLGFPIYSTNQCPDDLTGSNYSAIIFGNWSDLMIGFWGGMSLQVDDTTLGTQGARRIIVLQDMDTGVRHAQSFAACTTVDQDA